MKQRLAKQKLIQEVESDIMEQKIEQARELLKTLESGKKENSFEQAKRFLLIQDSLRCLRQR